MPQPNEDDFFAGSTMSFGEHLEELRVTLFRAIFGIVVGALIGLIFASRVVGVIQGPLEGALRKYYKIRSQEDLKTQYPGEVPADILKFIEDHGYIAEPILIERAEARRMIAMLEAHEAPSSKSADASDAAVDGAAEGAAAAAAKPALSIEGDLPPPTPDFLRTRIWRPVQASVKTLNAQEAFMIWLKAGLIFGVVLSSPWVFWQIWNFVAAGLYPHEQRYVYIYLPFSLILFLSGILLAFFVAFPIILDFLFSYNMMIKIDPDPRISEWLSFAIFLPLGFGISFQLPLVMLFLHRVGIVSIELYTRSWRVSILIILVISMLLTPADPYSMLLMAIPLIILYFLGILLCRWMPRGRNPFREVYEP